MTMAVLVLRLELMREVGQSLVTCSNVVSLGSDLKIFRLKPMQHPRMITKCTKHDPTLNGAASKTTMK